MAHCGVILGSALLGVIFCVCKETASLQAELGGTRCILGSGAQSEVGPLRAVRVARWPSPGGCPLPLAHGFYWPCLGSPSPAPLAGAALQRPAGLSWTAEGPGRTGSGRCLILGGFSQDSRQSGRRTGADEGPGRVSTATWGRGAQGAPPAHTPWVCSCSWGHQTARTRWYIRPQCQTPTGL